MIGYFRISRLPQLTCFPPWGAPSTSWEGRTSEAAASSAPAFEEASLGPALPVSRGEAGPGSRLSVSSLPERPTKHLRSSTSPSDTVLLKHSNFFDSSFSASSSDRDLTSRRGRSSRVSEDALESGWWWRRGWLPAACPFAADELPSLALLSSEAGTRPGFSPPASFALFDSASLASSSRIMGLSAFGRGTMMIIIFSCNGLQFVVRVGTGTRRTQKDLLACVRDSCEIRCIGSI
jgi:hypothetical protein